MGTPSLNELINTLGGNENQFTDIDTLNYSGKVPAYLYRGESKLYETVKSSEYRFKNNPDICPILKREVLFIMEECAKTMRECGYPVELMSSLFQHYGFPTPIIDTTSSLKVAASFAAHKNGMQKGRILLYKMEELVKDCYVINLDNDQIPARRPKRQKGFTIFHKQFNFHFSNLDEIKPEIFVFQGTESDIKKYDKNDYYCDSLKNDPVSGFLNDLIFRKVLDENGVLNGQKISEDTKIWIDDKIPWCEYPRSVQRDQSGNKVTIPDFENFDV
jgi:hypothetical protein